MSPELKKMISNPWVLFVLAVICSGVAWYLFQSVWENYKKQKAINQLDGPSLSILATQTGLVFSGIDLDRGTLRHLIALDLIHTELFPVELPAKDKVSWGHYLTKEGRMLIAKRLGREDLYPDIFCDMLRVRYWKGNMSLWSSKQSWFTKQYGIVWQKCWDTHLKYLQKEDSSVNSENDLGPTIKYLNTHSFDIVMEKIVRPWKKDLGLTEKD